MQHPRSNDSPYYSTDGPADGSPYYSTDRCADYRAVGCPDASAVCGG